MMKAVPVSVVIPAYNCGAWIEEAVDSVLRQSSPPQQIVIVDDGSTDDTAERVRRYDRLGAQVRYIRQQNQGVSAARNRGVAVSELKYVAFLDADDVWHPKKLELQIRLLDSWPGLGLLGTAAYDWPARDLPAHQYDDGRKPVTVTWEQLAVRNRLITSSVLARRSVLMEAGKFDTALQGPEDRDLWLRVAERAAACLLTLPRTIR